MDPPHRRAVQDALGLRAVVQPDHMNIDPFEYPIAVALRTWQFPEAPRLLRGRLASGLRNQGLFATHELEKGVPQRPDWPQAQHKATPLLDKRGRDLLAGLGFQVSDTNQQYAILRCGQTKMAVAVFLDRSEACDIASDRFGGMTPVQYALAKADDENLDYAGGGPRIVAADSHGGGQGRGPSWANRDLRGNPS